MSKHSVIGEYEIEAATNLNLIARGNRVSVRAISETGNVMVDATRTVTIMSGPAFVAVESDLVGGKAVVCGGELGTIVNMVGPPLAGAQLKMMPELVTITVGAPGAGSSITMTPESITFKVAEVTFTLTPEGITENVAEVSRETTPEGHTLTAGETVLNVGVAGIEKEAPTETSELEGAAELNVSVLNQSVDGTNTLEASMSMLE